MCALRVRVAHRLHRQPAAVGARRHPSAFSHVALHSATLQPRNQLLRRHLGESNSSAPCPPKQLRPSYLNLGLEDALVQLVVACLAAARAAIAAVYPGAARALGLEGAAAETVAAAVEAGSAAAAADSRSAPHADSARHRGVSGRIHLV